MASKNTASVPGRALGRRISPAELGYKKENLQEMVFSDKNAEHFLYRVVGVVTGLKPYRSRLENSEGDTQFGLLGQFEATLRDGEQLSGSTLYLPSYVQGMITAALSLEDTHAVRIAFDIYVSFNAESATSYTYIARDLLNEGVEDMEKVKSEIRALPMPPRTLALPSK